MNNLFKICDLYGTEFHWYFEYKPKFYTYYGGILSLLSILCCIGIFFIFGLEDFQRLHPISSVSNVPPLVHKTIQFGKKKIYLPWRIMDYSGKFINHKGILFPRIYYFTNKLNKNTGLLETYYSLLNYTFCNETSMKDFGSDFLIDLNFDNLFCIDMEDIDMGGSWNSDFVNYIRLDLNLCQDGLNYNNESEKCTKKEYLNQQFGENNNWFFQLLYPAVQFQPKNKTMPILVLYTSYYYGLSTSSNKLDRIYIQEHIFEDEQGWIMNKKANVTYWGVSTIKADYYTIGEKDIFRYGSNSRLYSFKIYLDYGTVYYTRKYKKLFEILSELFPIIKGIFTFFCFISRIINKLKITKKINEYIIGSEINQYKKKSFQNGKRNHHSLNSLTNIRFSHHPEKIKESILSRNPKLYDLKDSSKILCITGNNNNFKFSKPKLDSKKKLSLVDYLNPKLMDAFNFSIMNQDIFEIFEKKKPNFPMIYYLIGFFLNRIQSKKRNNYLCISEKFDISFTFFTHLIDITSYISLYQQFESIKRIISENFKSNNIEVINEEIPLNNNKKVQKNILKQKLTFD